MKEIKMKDSKETAPKNKNQAPDIDIDPILTRIDELEERCNQLETSLNDTVTFDSLAVRLTGKKIVKKKTSQARIVTRREICLSCKNSGSSSSKRKSST
jgi:hypothetical protein